MCFFWESFKAARYGIITDFGTSPTFWVSKKQNPPPSRSLGQLEVCKLEVFSVQPWAPRNRGWILPTKHSSLGRRKNPEKYMVTVGLDDPFPAFGKLTLPKSRAGWLWFFVFRVRVLVEVFGLKSGAPRSWGIVSLHSALESDERSGFAGFVWFTAVYIITHQSEIPSSNSKWIAGHKAVACKYPKKAYTHSSLS